MRERDRDIEHHRRQIEIAEAACAADISFSMAALQEYLEKHPIAKDTKTQRSIPLECGKLVMRKPSPQYTPINDEFVIWLKTSDYPDFIRTEEKALWGEFKKQTALVDGQLIDRETGEVVRGVKVTIGPAKFEIKEAAQDE